MSEPSQLSTQGTSLYPVAHPYITAQGGREKKHPPTDKMEHSSPGYPFLNSSFPSSLNHSLTAGMLQVLLVLPRSCLCFCLVSPPQGILSFQGLFGPKRVVIPVFCTIPGLSRALFHPPELICIPTETLRELWEYFWSVSEIVTQWLTCNLFGFSLSKTEGSCSLISSFTCIWLLGKQTDGSIS